MTRNSRCKPHVQTLILPKSGFTKAQARAWAKRYGFDIQYIDVKAKSYRIRQRDPKGFRRFASKKLPNGVVIVNGYC
jgi:hypothetical protein